MLAAKLEERKRRLAKLEEGRAAKALECTGKATAHVLKLAADHGRKSVVASIMARPDGVPKELLTVVSEATAAIEMLECAVGA